MLLGCGGAGQRPAAEVQKGLVADVFGQPGQQLVIFTLDQRRIVLEANHVLGEHRIHRRLDAGGGMPLDRVDEIVGHHLTRALVLEVPGRAAIAQHGAGQRRIGVVAVLALRIDRKRRVRLVAHAGLDRHVVDALGDRIGRGVVGQDLAVLVQVARLDDSGGGLGHQLVRALQVVVAVGRVVHLHGVGRLGVAVGRGRVQVARRAFVERVEQRVLALSPQRVGVVVAARRQQAGGQGQRQAGAAPQRDAEHNDAAHADSSWSKSTAGAWSAPACQP